MLASLHVRNFVLMETLELHLEPGFNVLTGETGAGKSIVVGALGLVLGGRARTEHIRPGAQEAEVSALFLVGDGPRAPDTALAKLEADGLLRDGELAIRRVVQAGGRSRAYINGRLCTAAELAALAPELADVASQHESVALTDPATHLDHLDRYADLAPSRDALSESVSELLALTERIRDLRDKSRDRAEREAFVRFQRTALEELDPRPGELDELATERRRLRHATRLLELTQRASGALDQAEDGVCDRAARIASDLDKAAELDPVLAPIAETMRRAYEELCDVSMECSRYAERADMDPSRLSEVEERLFRLESALRQYGPTLDDVIAARARLDEELLELETTDERISELSAEREARLRPVAESARALSEARRFAAEGLGAAISRELAELGMGGARVVVEVEPLGRGSEQLEVDGARLSRAGIDRVEFMIAPNKGIEPRPLRKIASGGELSRSLLALKRVLAAAGPAGLYVFDEVDAGVGGAVAEKIGRAIADVARHHQVLCITHLAPIAAFADAHYVVEKQTADAVVRSGVRRLEREEPVDELARMISGERVTGAARDAAAALAQSARDSKVAARPKKAAPAPATAPPKPKRAPARPRYSPKAGPGG